METEPTLEQIDDYNNNESPEKRKIIHFVILFLIVVSITYGFFKFNYYYGNDYIGTSDKPGIVIVNH